MPRKPRVLIIGDGGVPTGYARVIRSIFEPLCGDFEILHLATRHPIGRSEYHWRVFPADRTGDPYGLNRVPGLIDEHQPDIVFLLYDLRFQSRYIERIRCARYRPEIIVYSPIEAGPVEPELLAPAAATTYVVFTEFARQEVSKSIRSAAKYGLGSIDLTRLEVIPHGVDTKTFSPLPGDDRERRAAARHAIGLSGEDKSYVILNANRNISKKRLDVTLEGFARFSERKPTEVKLLLHSESTSEWGWNLPLLARRYGILDRLILTSSGDRRMEYDDDLLNQLYNACDVGLNTSIGEGWGMISFEHGATRSAQIVPGSPNLAEIWGDAALILSPTLTFPTPFDHTQGVVVDAETVAAGLELLYQEPHRRLEMAESAYQRAHDPSLNWATISETWRELLNCVAG